MHLKELIRQFYTVNNFELFEIIKMYLNSFQRVFYFFRRSDKFRLITDTTNAFFNFVQYWNWSIKLLIRWRCLKTKKKIAYVPSNLYPYSSFCSTDEITLLPETHLKNNIVPSIVIRLLSLLPPLLTEALPAPATGVSEFNVIAVK